MKTRIYSAYYLQGGKWKRSTVRGDLNLSELEQLRTLLSKHLESKVTFIYREL